MENQKDLKCKHCQGNISAEMNKCPQCGDDLTTYAKRHPIITTLLAIFVIFILPSLLLNMSGSGSSSGNSISTDTTDTTTKQYVEVFKFSGNGQKKSEPFSISGSRFKIAYNCTGDPNMTYCGAFVYKVGSQLPQGVMNSAKPIKDETVIYDGGGEFYIDANTMGNFTMTIYDYK